MVSNSRILLSCEPAKAGAASALAQARAHRLSFVVVLMILSS
jgi:hypothetical protein